jgi:hypothetical protein
VAWIVNPKAVGKPRLTDGSVPHLTSKVGVAERLTLRRLEDERVRIIAELAGEVLGQEIAEEVRNHDHPRSSITVSL